MKMGRKNHNSWILMAILSGYNDHQSSFLGECPISFSDEPNMIKVY
jgi:hypothetical protein